MVIWSPSQTDGFPQGMINISCITCFVIVVNRIKFESFNYDPISIYHYVYDIRTLVLNWITRSWMC